MSTYAETANSFYFEPRKIAASLLLATTMLTLVGRCGGDDNANGPRSPIDTNGTRGSGYTPPGGWGGGYQPKGMGVPGKTHTELPDTEYHSLGAPERLGSSAITLPGEIMGTTTIVLSFGEAVDESILPPQQELTEA